MKSPMNSVDFANYMRRNLEMAIKMENDLDLCKYDEH
jgi:hypothetical protein